MLPSAEGSVSSLKRIEKEVRQLRVGQAGSLLQGPEEDPTQPPH